MRDFGAVDTIAEVMAGFPRPWWIAGGWAIDLFLGEVTRDHADVEVGIFRQDQNALHPHFAGWDLFKVVFGAEGGALKPWEAGEWLAEPAHQIYAARPGDTPWDLCFFLNELSDGTWKFGRNHAITRPPAEIVILTPNGIPIMSPEIQLAYKAKHHQPRDEHDFERAHGQLTPAQRVWLRETLQLCHPGDPWIARL